MWRVGKCHCVQDQSDVKQKHIAGSTAVQPKCRNSQRSNYFGRRENTRPDLSFWVRRQKNKEATSKGRGIKTSARERFKGVLWVVLHGKTKPCAAVITSDLKPSILPFHRNQTAESEKRCKWISIIVERLPTFLSALKTKKVQTREIMSLNLEF